MSIDHEFQRRMASLARAETDRAGNVVVSRFAAVALARRLQWEGGRKVFGVDPVLACSPDARPLLLQH